MPPINQSSRARRHKVATTAVAVIASLAFSSTQPVVAATLTQIGADGYVNTDSQHATQVEPDSFAFGSTIIAAAQTGRFFDGGSSNINFSTSTDGGNTWVSGALPGITKHNLAAPGPYDRVSDPAVAYDPKRNVWMISSLPLLQSGTAVNGAGVVTSRSTDGGLTWSTPVLVTGSNLGNVDKNWIACDTTSSSPFYGNCYTEWDDNGDGNRIYMSTSIDGGVTWGPRLKTANNATGLGGQPLVQPNGTVIVPIDNANETRLLAFRSTDGGASWTSTVNVATIIKHTVAGGLRTGPLPSAEIDGSGKVYVVWQDCRFRSSCRANDIVLTTSTDGVNWSAVTRIPIDATNSQVDHFIPGIAVDRATLGGGARIALGYYYYPVRNCTFATCQLNVGYVSSNNGGATWTVAQQLAGPMTLAWLPNTSQGRMVGDYKSTSFVSGGAALPVFAVAKPNSGVVFNQAIYTSLGLTAARNPVEVPMVDEPSYEFEPVPGTLEPGAQVFVSGGVPVNADNQSSDAGAATARGPDRAAVSETPLTSR